MSKRSAANEGSLRRHVRFLRRELREIVKSVDPHMDEDGYDIDQDAECFCARCVAVRALKHREPNAERRGRREATYPERSCSQEDSCKP